MGASGKRTDARKLPRDSVARLLVGQWRPTFIAAILLFTFAASRAAAADLQEASQLFRSGKYAECVDVTAKAIEDGEFSESWPLLQLKSQLALGRYADALVTLDAALKRFQYSLPLRWVGREVCRFNKQADRATVLEGEISELVRQQGWRYRDPASLLVLGRLALTQGIDAKKVLDEVYTPIKKQLPNYIDVYHASGELSLEKHDYALAAEAYEQAIKIDAGDPDAHYGLAQAFAASDEEKAKESLAAALAKNPNHVPSLLMLVDGHVDAENYDEAEKLLAQVLKINSEHSQAWAYRAVVAHLTNQPAKEKVARQAALKWWPANPEVDHLIGRKLSQNYRFAEGAAYQRNALKLSAGYLPAKMQLAQDLLRLGQEEEGWKLADDVFSNDAYNVVAHNLVTLQDSLSKFRTLESDGFHVRMDSREAEIYGPRVLDLLKRARKQLCKKYDVELEGPIVVELFPRQQDFAIRTFGLPGGGMFLAVCFGNVITANSPASQSENPANWEATLWHEFCHVVTLNKTNNKMPRWLSEGISVYEERLADPTWGQSITPRYREMMLGDELTPVSELSGAFLKAESPLHVQFAYYESSLVVEFLVEKYGIETLKRVLVDLGVGMPINDSLARYTGSLAALDKEFTEFAHKRAKSLAPAADWTEPELPPLADAKQLAAWVKEHPNNYQALQRLAKRLIADKQWKAAKEPLAKMRELYPTDAGPENPHTMLAAVHRELGETSEEQAVLKSLAELSADDVAALARLSELASEAKDWPMTLKYATRLLAVNPLQRAPHRQVAAAAQATGNDALAIESYRALLLLEPADPAEIHFQLATLLQRTGELATAKRHALQALEEAPRYRAAHARLLEIVAAIAQNEKQETKP